MSETRPLPQRLTLVSIPLLTFGAACVVVAIIAGFFPWGHDQFFRSWLFGWIFWLGVPLGCLGILMLWHLTGGTWGYMIRPFAETAVLCLPLVAVLFIPLIIGVSHVYPWAVPEFVKQDPVVAHRVRWMNWPFWTIRAVVFLLVFIVMGQLLQTRVLERAGVEVEPVYARLRRVSAGGMPIYFVIMSLAAIDWIMSRDPHWYSSVFGFIVCISQAISGCCLLIVMLWVFHEEDPLRRLVSPNLLNDLGNILMTFVILWAYLSFAQFLVVWVGNKQDEITWYIQRTRGGWRLVGSALMLFHFLVPFIILLQRPLKRKMGRLAAIAAGIFIIHILDELYWVTPADPHGSVWGVGRWVFAEFMNLIVFLGIGGLWLGWFLWLLRNRPLLPIGDRVPVIPVDHGHGQRPAPGAVE